jgi:hypothetical protein
VLCEARITECRLECAASHSYAKPASMAAENFNGREVLISTITVDTNQGAGRTIRAHGIVASLEQRPQTSIIHKVAG